MEFNGKIYTIRYGDCEDCEMSSDYDCGLCGLGDEGKCFFEIGVTKNNQGGSTPSQYALPNDAHELQDLIEYREMNFSLGNIFKACYRYGHKENVSREYDLNKIIYFAQRELARISKEEMSS